MIDIAVLRYWRLSAAATPQRSGAPDDLYKLAGMVFDAADIGDSHIRRGRNDTTEPVRKLPVAATRPRGQPFGKNLRRRRNRNYRDVRIDAPRRFHHRTRHIGDDGATSADILINLARQSIAMAMGFPIKHEFIARERLPERQMADLQVILEG